MRLRPGGIGVRIAAAALAVALVTLAIVAAGVLRVGADAFMALMMAAGSSADDAHRTFEASVSAVLGGAALAAVVAALVLASVLARRIARPIERLAAAAGRAATGDLAQRVPEEGPAEVRALAVAHNAMLAELERQEAMRREFVVNASHELRTPLTNLLGYLEALRDGVLPPDPALFDSLREEVDRLTRLAASLDALAASGVAHRPAVPVDLRAAVRTAVDLAAPGFGRRAIRVTEEIAAGEGPAVLIAADELAQVLGNLLQNATRYTPQGGAVRVRTDVSHREGEVPMGMVLVANTGPGIPADELPRVWDRFYRVEKSRDRASGGAGIGLAIVRGLVERAGGRVALTSDGAWTTFEVRLPVARSGGPGDGGRDDAGVLAHPHQDA